MATKFVYSEQDVKEITAKFRELQIPCDAIYLDIDEISGGLASIEEIRNALIDFKKTRKRQQGQSNLFIFEYLCFNV